MFDSQFISCPARGFEHLLEIATKEFNALNGHPQYDVHYPTSMKSLSNEELEIIQEMEDEDGCQQWRNDSTGYCSCEDCSELVTDPDIINLYTDPDHQIHRPDDDYADLPVEAHTYYAGDDSDDEPEDDDMGDMDYLGLEDAIKDFGLTNPNTEEGF